MTQIRKARVINSGGSHLCPPNGTVVFIKESTLRTCTPFYSFSLDGVHWLDEIYAKRFETIEDEKPQVLPASSIPPVSVKREVLTIDKIGVGQTFIVHGVPEEVYVKISNSHVFNHKLLQMHATVSERFKSHLNLVVVELVVYNGK